MMERGRGEGWGGRGEAGAREGLGEAARGARGNGGMGRGRAGSAGHAERAGHAGLTALRSEFIISKLYCRWVGVLI